MKLIHFQHRKTTSERMIISHHFKYLTNWAFILSRLISLFSTIDCRILRLSCKSVAEFSIEKQGYHLEGYVIKRLTDVGLYECYESCLHDNRCKSINIEAGEYGICELNRASSNDFMDNVTLTYNARWIFRSTNFSDLRVSVVIIIVFPSIELNTIAFWHICVHAIVKCPCLNHKHKYWHHFFA